MATNLAFNEQFYLTNNPDVAFAISRGQFASAEQHFNLFGRFEARNPNQYFDVTYYLTNNPDVAAARANPLEHFINFGAAEGRFANASIDAAIDTDGNNFANEFDAQAYLEANPDLANAVGAGRAFETAYEHYVLFGQFESRPGTPAGGPFTNTGNTPGAGQTFTLTDGVDTFIGGALNDTFQAAEGTLNTFDRLEGGGGNDTLNLIIGNDSAVNVPAGATVTGIETININRTGSTAGDIDASGFVGAQAFWQSGSDGNILNLGAGQTAGFRGTDGNVLVAYQDGVENASIALENLGSAGSSTTSLDISGTDVTSVSVTGSVAAAGDDNGVLRFGAPTADGTNYVATSIETVNVALTSDTTVEFEGGFASLITFDATASTGDITVDFSSFAEDLSIVRTGSGADVVTTGVQTGLTINLGAGNDVLNFNGAGSGTITTGTGNDLITISAITNVGVAEDGEFEADFADSIIQITDFNGTQDVLSFTTQVTNTDGDISVIGSLVGFQTLNNQQTGNISSADSLFDAVGLASGYVGANGSAVFQYQGSTYVYQNDGQVAFDAGDGLVQLVGFTGALTDSNFINPTVGV